MVDEHAASDRHGRMDVDAEHRGGPALQIEREVLQPALPQEVREAMGLQRMEALEIEQGLDRAAASRIAVADRRNIGADGGAGSGLGLE
jgi:2-polyprenyl-6-methoxyphenol hydroxylase-like FAD-dependent oxidoreductase